MLTYCKAAVSHRCVLHEGSGQRGRAEGSGGRGGGACRRLVFSPPSGQVSELGSGRAPGEPSRETPALVPPRPSLWGPLRPSTKLSHAHVPTVQML